MLTISPEQAGQRIDNFLMTVLKGVPKSRIYRAIRQGEVRVNKCRVNSMYKLKSGDEIRIPPIRVSASKQADASAYMLETIQKSIIFDHPDFLILNKPAGMAVHGGSSIKIGLIEALKQSNPAVNYYLIHRLDKDTSGCLLIAKTRQSMLLLQDKIREHQIQKEYVLLVHGRWPKSLTSSHKPLAQKIIGGEKMVTVDEAGKNAITEFQVIRYVKNLTLLRAVLITGRMHQIRVHAAAEGHPIVGDRKYGDRTLDKTLSADMPIKHLFLHAERLTFRYPNDDSRIISVTAPGFFVDECNTAY